MDWRGNFYGYLRLLLWGRLKFLFYLGFVLRCLFNLELVVKVIVVWSFVRGDLEEVFFGN